MQHHNSTSQINSQTEQDIPVSGPAISVSSFPATSPNIFSTGALVIPCATAGLFVPPTTRKNIIDHLMAAYRQGAAHAI